MPFGVNAEVVHRPLPPALTSPLRKAQRESRLSGFAGALARRKMRAKIARRLAEHPFKGAIELGERLKSNVVGNLADAQIGVEQAGTRIFDAHTRDIIGEL